MGRAIGIDLGTTNTVISVMDSGRPRVLVDDKGYKVLPSCISMKEDGGFIVGQAARDRILTSPDETLYSVKRLIGRLYDSEEMLQLRRHLGYPIRRAEDGSCALMAGGEAYNPTEVSALVLQVAKGIAERSLGEEVSSAVITVPAYFNHAQRKATLAAAKVAGIQCDRLLNEPTAAALAYGFRDDNDQTLLVYDLGGGTFDVSVLRIGRGVFEVLSTSGDTYLGGDDFDVRIMEHLAQHFQEVRGVDLRDNRDAMQRLKLAGEAAKQELSYADRTMITIPRITADADLELAISRGTLESLVADLVDRTVEVAVTAVADASLELSEIDSIMLVGGQTRMPRIRSQLREAFGKEPSRSAHPDEVVALGAAIHAAQLAEPANKQALLIDVTPFDLGMDVAGGLFQPLISRNSTIPTNATLRFATNQDNQDQIKVIVRQGEHRVAIDNEFLGEFVMGGLTPAPRMETKIDVSFRLDHNGMLQVSATEAGTGLQKSITIRNYGEAVASDGKVAMEIDGGSSIPDSSLPERRDAQPAAEQKKGFFGRLFGRRRDKKKPEPRPKAQTTVPRTTEPRTTEPRTTGPLPVPAPRPARPVPDVQPLAEHLVEEVEIETLSMESIEAFEAPTDSMPPGPFDDTPAGPDPFALDDPEPLGFAGDPFADDPPPAEGDPFAADPFAADPLAPDATPAVDPFADPAPAPAAPTVQATPAGTSDEPDWGDIDGFAPLDDDFAELDDDFAELDDDFAELDDDFAELGGEWTDLGDDPLGDDPLGDDPLGDDPLGDDPLGDDPLADLDDDEP